MGQIPMKGGTEFDYLTEWRQFFERHAGDARTAKKSYNRRFRHEALKDIRRQLDLDLDEAERVFNEHYEEQDDLDDLG